MKKYSTITHCSSNGFAQQLNDKTINVIVDHSSYKDSLSTRVTALLTNEGATVINSDSFPDINSLTGDAQLFIWQLEPN